MGIFKMQTRDLIDSEAEIHYAFHQSIRSITVEHRHDFYEIFLLTHGSVVHVINGKRQVLEEGALVFMRPHDIHYYAKDGTRPCHLINLAFPESTTNELFSYLGSGFAPERLLQSEMPPMTMLPKAEMNLVKAQLEELNTIPRTQKAAIRTRLRVLLVELFSKHFPVRKRVHRKTIPDWLDWLVNEMHKKENFTAGLARMQHLSHRSAEHLSRLFRKHLDVTPTQFVNDLRLNYAANLLANTDEHIVAISLEAGFENLSHFYHLFRKKFNQSPKQFRNSNKRTSIP